ncbi:ATP-binding protein [Actinophytocola sp.]|uniref:ATP-binding protein n=1 Tax=Actinophytocola sp. TaxID=1872138 RepID=UPI002ED50DF5
MEEPPGISRSFPAPSQLPPPPGHFIGRRDALTQLTAAMDDAAGAGETVVISTITGPGGVGKTWLGLQWAHQHRHLFPDGQLFVDLGGFSPDGEPTAPTVAVRYFLDAFGVEPALVPGTFEAQVGLYRTMVANRRMLIMLDNAKDSAHVASLLPGSPTCTVLITSRDKLIGLNATQGARRVDLDVLTDEEADELLADRLGRQRQKTESQAVAELIAYCAGLPLALGIVAGRAAEHRAFPLATWVDELRDSATRLDTLDTGDPTASLTAVLSWSTATLATEQAETFALLGLAPVPDISTAAAADLNGLPVSRTKVALEALERVSLIQQHVPGRWRMHDLVRLHAKDQAAKHLSEPVQLAALRRIGDFYVHTAYAADQLLDPHRESVELAQHAPGCHPHAPQDTATALAWLDTEHPGLLAAQRLAVAMGWHTPVWQLAPALHTYHWRRGRLSDQVAVGRAGLNAARHLGDPAVQALAHRLLAEACALLGQHAEALDHLDRAMTLATHARDMPSQAHTQRILAWAWGQQGNVALALKHAARSLQLFQTLGNQEWEARGLNQTAWYAGHTGQYEQARTYCEAALKLHRDHQNRNGEALSLGIHAYLAFWTGQYRQALDYSGRSIALHRDIGNTYYEADILTTLGQAHAAMGEHARARDAWHQALRLYKTQNRTKEAAGVQQLLGET